MLISVELVRVGLISVEGAERFRTCKGLLGLHCLPEKLVKQLLEASK